MTADISKKNDPRSAADFLTPEERQEVKGSIAQAELRTSGEIRVHLDSHCEGDVLDHAVFIFEDLGMHRTEQRNGVLIYVSVADHRLAVIGDAGINAIVPKGFWKDVVGVLRLHFAAGRAAEGLVHAIGMIGEKLAGRFPLQADDTDELSNDISIG